MRRFDSFPHVLVVTVVCAIAVVGLVAYELFSFEWKDWRDDGFPPGELGNTADAVLWAFSTLWSLSQVIHGVLEISSNMFCEFSEEKKTRVVKYFMQITWGSVMSVTLTILHLVFQGYVRIDCSSDLECAAQWSWPYTHVATLYVTLYMWEMVFERTMHKTLMLHHSVIIILFHVSIGYYATRHDATPLQLRAIGALCFPQLVAAGLEQPCFISLLLHRFRKLLKRSVVVFASRVSWVSFGVTKALALIFTVQALVEHWDNVPIEYAISILAGNCVLAPIQAYSTIVLWMISRSEQRKTVQAALAKLKAHDPESSAAADNVEPVILDVPPAKEMDDTEHFHVSPSDVCELVSTCRM